MAKKWYPKLFKALEIEMVIPTGYTPSEGHEGFYGFKRPDEGYVVCGLNPTTDDHNPYNFDDFDFSDCSLDIEPNKGRARKRKYKGK